MDELEFTPEQWCALYGVRILDADGWRSDGKDYNEPLTFDDWHARMVVSTTNLRP